jgi:hypothetical protein
MRKSLHEELVLPALARTDAVVPHDAPVYAATRDALICLGARRLERALSRHMSGVVHGAAVGAPAHVHGT